MGIGALYRRYPSKDDLLIRRCVDGLDRYIEVAQAAVDDVDGDPWEVFVAFMAGIVEADTITLTIHLAGRFTPTDELQTKAGAAFVLNETADRPPEPRRRPGRRFHLVIPSIPGVAFSGPTTEPGWTVDRTARAWVELMARLGYDRYGAHGNDGGSMISPEVGRHDPDHVVGVHVTQLFSFPSGDPAEFVDMTEEDGAAMQFLQEFTTGGGLAYNAYQSAQPQTLTYALQNSPAGWVAWVGQLFQRRPPHLRPPPPRKSGDGGGGGFVGSGHPHEEVPDMDSNEHGSF